MEIPVRNLIFLQGVFFSNIRTIEDIVLDEPATDHAAVEAQTDMIACASDARATRFISKQQWIDAYKGIALKCWHCGLGFKGFPCFIPRQIRVTPTGKEYDTLGLFCGFACAYSFLRTRHEFHHDKTYCDKLGMLKMLFASFYNKRILEFKEAPNPYDMITYGGSIDMAAYRNQLQGINAEIVSSARRVRN